MDKILLAERELLGTGALYHKDEYLGDGRYSLSVRKSRIKFPEINQTGSPGQSDQIIISVMGTLVPDIDAGEKLAQCCQDAKGHTLTLHLNDDFFMLVSVFAIENRPELYKVFGRIVTENSTIACPFL